MATAEQTDDLETLMAKAIVTMQPVRPDLIRTVPAYRAMAWCGRPLLGRAKKDSLRFTSSASRIQEFWSHSWHGARWKVVLTVLLLNNSLAAAVVSIVVATAMGVIYAFDLLPRIQLGDFVTDPSHWSHTSGVIAYTLALLLWPSRKRVFFDMLCINQHDEEEKCEALISMAAFLKRSDSLVVFWDPSYPRRLWCVFELAAYIHSREPGQPQRMVIRPTIVGPCFLSITFSLSFYFALLSFVGDEDIGDLFLAVAGVFFGLCFCVPVRTFRAYFHSVQQCQQEMKEFKFDAALCACCTTGHTDRDGKTTLCDRQILGRCTEHWFGSKENFEKQVRAEIEEGLSLQLLSQFVSYKQCLLTLVPFGWGAADLFFGAVRAEFDKHGRWERDGVVDLLQVFSLWLGVGPLLICLALRLAALNCARPRDHICVNILVNLLIVLFSAGVGVLIFWQVEPLFWRAVEHAGQVHYILEIGSFFFAMTFTLLALLCFHCSRRSLARSMRSKSFANEAGMERQGQVIGNSI